MSHGLRVCSHLKYIYGGVKSGAILLLIGRDWIDSSGKWSQRRACFAFVFSGTYFHDLPPKTPSHKFSLILVNAIIFDTFDRKKMQRSIFSSPPQKKATWPLGTAPR